jgi:ubiquitin C-terminal hydrolase
MNILEILEEPSAKGLSTLINIGNSCYINVCIQVLGHTLPLRNLFVSGMFKETFQNEPISLKTKFVTDYYNLSKGMYGDNEDCIVQPITFRNTLIRCVDQFKGSRQQDAHECLIFILQLLHDGLSIPVSVDIVSETPGRNPTLSWASFLKHEKNSHIIQWFYGQYESMKQCLNCQSVFPTYDAWNCLSLEIPISQMKSQFSLDDLLTAHVAPERLEDKYNCEKCQGHQDAISQHLIWKCPPILVIQMKRFRSNGGKIVVPIEYPLELDLRKYISPNNKDQTTVYDLYAVIYHQGQLNGGHYYASCKVNAAHGQWYNFNDDKQHLLDTDRIVSPFAYVLFYKKRLNESTTEKKPPGWNQW